MPTLLDLLRNIEVLEGSDVDRLKNVWIDGIEATQTIQYYKADQHLTDPSTRASDNSVVLAGVQARVGAHVCAFRAFWASGRRDREVDG